MAVCGVPSCRSMPVARAMCPKHYQRWKAHGTTDDPKPTREERFWAKVDRSGPGGCWLWTASTREGYGYFGLGRRDEGMVDAHRFAYELLVGPIPAGLEIDHLCRVRRCVNPPHLEAVTSAENKRRALRVRYGKVA